MFDSTKYGNKDDLSAQVFVQTLKKYIGEEFVRNNRIEADIDSLVLYVQD